MVCRVVCNRDCIYSGIFTCATVLRVCTRESLIISKNGQCLDFIKKRKEVSL
jgi:hypothetical protein